MINECSYTRFDNSSVKQRVYGIGLGYADLNDHDQLRHDPLLAVLCDKPDPTGQSRWRAQDRGKALLPEC